MSTALPVLCSCWECVRGEVLPLPCGRGHYVDCPPVNWMSDSCAARLLDTVNNPSRPSQVLRTPMAGSILNRSVIIY
jgi:hypothetical protein